MSAATGPHAPPAPADDATNAGVRRSTINTPGGRFQVWTRSRGNNPRITVPTLTIGAAHDTLDPAHMRAMAQALPQGRYRHCPDGSLMAKFDDPVVYVQGLLRFLREADASTA